jgi:hypothetical protein
MAYGKTAGCVILAGMAALSAAQFPVRHEHLRRGCAGTMTIDQRGVAFAGPRGHAWTWPFQEIRQLTVSPEAVTVLAYDDTRLKLGPGRRYVFTGAVPAAALYPLLREHMDQRLVAAVAVDASAPGAWSVPVKLVGPGSQGTVAFGPQLVVYSTKAPGGSRTWRYTDIDALASGGPFDLSVTTLEGTFHFQLKQPLAEARYDELWMDVQRKSGRLR